MSAKQKSKFKSNGINRYGSRARPVRFERAADPDCVRAALARTDPMIALSTGTGLWIAAAVTDLRPGFDGLSGIIQTSLEASPFFRPCVRFSRPAGDQSAVVDGDGLCNPTTKDPQYSIEPRQLWC
jgi:hypothetical protein